MLSIQHFSLIVRHLDAVDQRVALRLDRSRPWSEPSLTSLLCDLLDDETEHDETLAYSRKDLKADLAKSDEALTISCKIESIEYLPEHERHVTQGDLGLIVAYRDRVSGEAWERGWLLQAKRATPALRERPAYTANSKFSVDAAQHRRIEILEEAVGADFIRYLLYLPRPAMLRDWDRARLAQARNAALSDHIFDYTYGQLLFEDAKAGCPTLAAGMMLSRHGAVPSTVLDAHAGLAHQAWPFSWFLVMQLAGVRAGPMSRSRGHRSLPEPEPIWHPSGDILGGKHPASANVPVVPLLRGEKHAVVEALRRCGEKTDNDRDFNFLPPHTMTIEVSPGGALPG